jgi:UDP-N-acetylmuramoylalanine--D-glutamate ligase
LQEAVNTALEIAADGDIVLLSPACTSYDMYRDFAERGDHFKALVRELTKPQKCVDSSER